MNIWEAPVGWSDSANVVATRSVVSAHKSNVHWFTNLLKEPAFIFNIHVMETNPENPNKPGRVYVDPIGEKIAGGLIRAPKITYGKANQMYG